MKNIIIPLLLCLVFLLGCKGKKENDNGGIKKTYYPNGQIKVEQQYVKDSKGAYIYNGYRKEYYEDGTLELLGFLKDNIQDSLCLRYYHNGILSDSLYLWHGRMMGFQYSYYDNGKPKGVTYQLGNSSGTFEIEYHENGSIDFINGKFVDVGLRNDTINQIFLGDTCKILNKVIVLKDVTTQLQVTVRDNKNEVITDTSMNKFRNHLNTFFYSYRHSFTQIGRYKYKVKTIATDDNTGKVIKEDSAEYILNVVGQ